MELYILANSIYLFKAVSYVSRLNVLWYLAKFVIEEFTLWNMTVTLFSSYTPISLEQVLHM